MRLPDSNARLCRARCVLLAAAILFALTACRSPGGAVPPALHQVHVEKPWTKETIEQHDDLYLELASGRSGVIVGPVLASDAHGEFLTTKADSSVHFRLVDVVVMDVFDRQAYIAAAHAAKPEAEPGSTGPASASGEETAEKPPEKGSAISVVAGSFFALWGAVIYFLPALAAYLILF